MFLSHLLQKPPVLFDSVPLLPRAQEIAKQHKRSVYDCLYVAHAEREKCDFVTADVKLVSAVKQTFPFVVDLGSMP